MTLKSWRKNCHFLSWNLDFWILKEEDEKCTANYSKRVTQETYFDTQFYFISSIDFYSSLKILFYRSWITPPRLLKEIVLSVAHAFLILVNSICRCLFVQFILIIEIQNWNCKEFKNRIVYSENLFFVRWKFKSFRADTISRQSYQQSNRQTDRKLHRRKDVGRYEAKY